MYTSDLFQSKSHINEDQECQVLYIDDKPVAKYTDPMQAKTQLAHLQSKFPAKKIELKKEMREASDPSGMMHAARHYNKSFIITAELAEGGTKKYRIHAQSERVAREKFSQHYNMAKVLNVEEEGVAEGSAQTYTVLAWKNSTNDSPDVEELDIEAGQARAMAQELKAEGYKVVKIQKQDMAEGRAPSVIQTIRDNISGAEISKDREGNLIFRRGFFYTNNGSAEQFAARIDNELTKLNIPHTIVDKGEVWRPFKGSATTKSQSHWWVKVKISQPSVAEARIETIHGSAYTIDPNKYYVWAWDNAVVLYGEYTDENNAKLNLSKIERRTTKRLGPAVKGRFEVASGKMLLRQYGNEQGVTEDELDEVRRTNPLARKLRDLERRQGALTKPVEQMFHVTAEHHGSNQDVPLYTKTYSVRANSEQEAINTVIKIFGGRNHRIEQDVAEGLPDGLSKSDYTPGATKKHVDTNCTTCHGRKSMYKLDGKLFADNKVGAERVKCPTCKGTGDKPGVAEAQNDYFKRRKDEEDRIAGTKAPAKRTPKQTDYEKKRKEQDKDIAEGGMPSSVIKSKQRYGDMSDKDFAELHQSKSDDDLVAMAWRHGYGKGSLHYVNKRKRGLARVEESRLYYNVIGTRDKDLKESFGMQQDQKGWFLEATAGRKRILEAHKAFGAPTIL